MPESQSPPETPPNEQQLNEPPPNSESASPPTQQTTPQTPSPTDTYARTLEATLQDYARQNAALQAKLDAASRGEGPAKPPTKTVEEARADYYNDPVTQTRALVREELTTTIAPIMDFIKSLDVPNSPFNRMYSGLRADPRFANHAADPQIEQTVRSLLERNELTVQNMQAAIIQAIGLKSAGMLGAVEIHGQPAPPAPTSQPAPIVTNPPHFRPSAPSSAPSDASKPKLRQLTENEERLRRERGQTVAEYLAWIDVPADQVVKSDVGKPDWHKSHGGR